MTTDSFTQEMFCKSVDLDELRRKWEQLTDDERREAFELFCDIEDCYPTSWQANENFYLYLRHQPLKPWTRHGVSS